MVDALDFSYADNDSYCILSSSLPENLACADQQFVRHDFVRPIVLSNHQPSQRTACDLSADTAHKPLSFQKSFAVSTFRNIDENNAKWNYNLLWELHRTFPYRTFNLTDSECVPVSPIFR